MNFSDLAARTNRYLGARGEVPPACGELVEACLAEARAVQRFRYVSRIFDETPAFLRKSPYAEYFAGCPRVALCAMTLGAEIDLRIRRLMRSDPARAVVLDAAASALLEAMSDEYEERFGAARTDRFCPGYGGSPSEDVREIFALLRPEKETGIALLPSGLMVPQKSMAGIVGIGRKAERRCGDCAAKEHCTWKEEGTTCFAPEKRS